jgi:hypothetical protein
MHNFADIKSLKSGQVRRPIKANEFRIGLLKELLFEVA